MNMSRISIMALLCSIMFCKSFGQINQDSLMSIWQDTAQEDTVRLAAIQKIAWDMVNKKPDSSLILAKMQLDFARSIGDMFWESKALNTHGAHYYFKGDFPKALKYYTQSASLKEEIGDLKGLGGLHNNIGYVYRNMGNRVLALEQFAKSQAVYEKLGDSMGISSVYNNLAVMCQEQEEFDKALIYYKKSLAIKEKFNDTKEIGIAYNNIGAVYGSLNDYKTSLEYYFKSLEIRQSMGDLHGMGVTYGNIGLNYTEMGEHNLAIEYIDKSIEIVEKLGFNSNLANMYYNKGNVYNEMGKHDMAITWCAKSLSIAEEIQAIPMKRISCHCLYKAYKSQKNFSKALEFHEKFKQFSDSLQHQETEQKLLQMEFAREMLTDSLSREEEKLKIELTHQQEIRSKNNISTILLVVGMFILLLAIGLLSRMLYFRKSSEAFQSKAEQLERQKLISEIDLLRTQVNPHFLFNSLSILSSLVRVNPDLAEQFIDQLSKSYRYILEQKEQNLVSLRTELEFIKAYTFLLKIRFENKFDIENNIQEHELDYYTIAPLTLQLLVENAVKHNKMSKEEPLVISFTIINHQLIVRNKLRTRSTHSKSTGIGLKNIKDRYALLSKEPVLSGEFEDYFIVQIPLLKREDDQPTQDLLINSI